MIHNEEHIPFLGTRYPGAMGRPAREALSDTWPVIGPLVARALAGESDGDELFDVASAPENVTVTYDRGRASRSGFLTLSASAVRDEFNRPAGVLLTTIDIADLRASEARFRALAETSPLGVGVSSLDGKIVYTNRSYEMILGVDEGALIGQPCAIEYYDPADRDVWIATMNDQRNVTDYEVRFRRQDGSPVWVSMNIAPIEYGGRQAIIGVVQEITERKRAEAAAELERTHRERDRLRQRLAAAEEAERGRLALEVHDQLGQQVTAFRLGVEDAIRLAAEQATSGAALMSRLSQLQKLAGSMTTGVRAIALELRPPELDDVGLASAIEIYAREWSTRYGVLVELEITGLHDGAIATDVSSALYRITQEALTNVAKHAGATQVSVVVRHADNEVWLIIEDDGRGFDVEEATGRSGIDRRFGLAGMQERAALAGGSVAVESSDGEGTTLYVRLPAPRSA